MPITPAPARQILLTGVTGFLGQAILRTLLEHHPEVRVTAVVRPKGTLSGQRRLEGLLRKPVFSSWADVIGADEVARILAERVDALEGDLSDMPAIDKDYDTVIHSAASVSFDDGIDEAFTTNVGGAKGLYEALLAHGGDPHVIHVSTAYVSGIAKGLCQEGPLEHSVDWRAEHAAALEARDAVEAESRQPEALREQMRRVGSREGRQGPKAAAAAAEAARRDWVHERLQDFGRTRAQSVGWTDIYTFTKAMAERVGEDLWRGSGHRLSFVRPSIIESALRSPFPGWIDGYKVADPLIMAYGKGMLKEFPALADSVLDVIPVDFVVNVVVALATQPIERAPEESYYQVVSGTSNPLPFHEFYDSVRRYFRAHPLEDASGQTIIVPDWTFRGVELVEQKFRLTELSASLGQEAVRHLPATRRTRAWTSQLHRTTSALGTLRKYIELYRQYTKTEMVFDDANTRALRAQLPESFLATSDFDVTVIDWADYLENHHLPAVTELTKAYSRRKAALRARAERAPEPMADGQGALAVFDLDGTVVSENIIQQYIAVVRAARPMTAWPKEAAGVVKSLPLYLRAEQRNRSELIRAVNRRYEGFRAEELRAVLRGDLGRRIRESIRPAALEVIEQHRANGYRTVLVTGALDVLVEPLADLFDDVVATQMHEDADGVLTGYLSTPPIVGESRANWLRKYAAQHSASLKDSYGYGDSVVDAAWLELVGTPKAVSPDLGLYSVAKKKHWAILEW